MKLIKGGAINDLHHLWDLNIVIQLFQVSLDALKSNCIHMVTYTKTNLTHIIETLEGFVSQKYTKPQFQGRSFEIHSQLGFRPYLK